MRMGICLGVRGKKRSGGKKERNKAWVRSGKGKERISRNDEEPQGYHKRMHFTAYISCTTIMSEHKAFQGEVHKKAQHMIHKIHVGTHRSV